MTAIEFNTQLVKQNNLLKNFALKLTRNMDDAVDLTQDTYVRALDNRDKFTDESNLRGWLLTIMKNIFLNGYKRNKRKLLIIETKKHELNNNKAYNNSESFTNVNDIKKEINNLTNELRIPFVRYYEGYSYEEIAAELDIPLGTVKSRIFWARKKLMNKLA